MNCLDFRRGVFANPLQLDAAAREHALACAACAEFLERQRELDTKLYDAIRIPVTDGLADRILVAHNLRRRGRQWLWALAATVVLGAGIAGLAPTLYGHALGREAIAHVQEEPQSFSIVARHAADLLPAALAAQRVKVAAAIGEVTYAQICPMKDFKARHLVVATEHGPVTMLLMPEDHGWRRRSVTAAHGMIAITIPVAKGSIAIVAANEAQALAVERSLVLS